MKVLVTKLRFHRRVVCGELARHGFDVKRQRATPETAQRAWDACRLGRSGPAINSGQQSLVRTQWSTWPAGRMCAATAAARTLPALHEVNVEATRALARAADAAGCAQHVS